MFRCQFRYGYGFYWSILHINTLSRWMVLIPNMVFANDQFSGHIGAPILTYSTVYGDTMWKALALFAREQVMLAQKCPWAKHSDGPAEAADCWQLLHDANICDILSFDVSMADHARVIAQFFFCVCVCSTPAALTWGCSSFLMLARDGAT